MKEASLEKLYATCFQPYGNSGRGKTINIVKRLKMTKDSEEGGGRLQGIKDSEIPCNTIVVDI